MQENFPQLRELNGRRALYVDGKPFLILGLQWDCDGCYTAEDMDPLFAHAERMDLNTASLLLYWREVEPEEGVYDFTMLDHRIELCRRHNLKMVLVWFASYKNACLTYAPDYIRADHQRFRKLVGKNGQMITNTMCPTSMEIRDRDEAALRQVFKHLKQVDSKEHTVILFQMENETGILGSDRCYCDTCNEIYEREGFAQRYGSLAPEAFSAASVADYCDHLTGVVKEIYPLPVYMNAWLVDNHRNQIAGVHYPSGGPVDRVLDVYRERIRHIDFLAPDIYQYSYRDFHKFCSEYTWEGNPLFIAECATGKGTRTEKNVFYALGEYAAIGFDPWAINRSCPDFMGQPLVNSADGVWSCEAYELKKSYKMIRNVMHPLVMAQNTPRVKAFVQEEGERGVNLQFGEVWLGVIYNHPQNAARGVVIQLEDDEFVISGAGGYFSFTQREGHALPIETVETGRFEDDAWKKGYLLARQNDDDSAGFQMRDCATVKVKLGRRLDKRVPHQ